MAGRTSPKHGYSKKELMKIIEKMDRDRHQELKKDPSQKQDTDKRGKGGSFTV